MKQVYLLHFDTPLSQGPDPRTGKERLCRHYIGSTDDLEARLDEHFNGSGSRLMQVLKERGITFQLARTWSGGRKMERKIKNQKHGPRLCPICNHSQ